MIIYYYYLKRIYFTLNIFLYRLLPSANLVAQYGVPIRHQSQMHQRHDSKTFDYIRSNVLLL